MNFRGVFLNGGEGGGFDGVVEARGKANRAQHAQFVFGETPFGIADGADEPSLKIVLAADIIEDFSGIVAHQQAVDGEITAGDVFLRCLGVKHAIGMAAVGIAQVGAKGGDFDLGGIARNKNNAELRADSDASGEKLQDTLRSSVGGHVVIGGLALKQTGRAHSRRRAAPDGPWRTERIANRIGQFAGIHGLIMRQVRPKVAQELR